MSITTLKRAATTATTAARNVEHVDDIRAAVELTEGLIKELERQKRELRTRAINAGLAHYQVTQRESVPAKATFIEIFGQETFDAVKTTSDVKRFVWID